MSLLLALTLAFGSPGAPAASPEAGAEATEMLPTPFTAEQIREGMPVGLVFDWSETKEGATSHVRWTVIAADEATVTIRFDGIDADGQLLEGEAAEKTFPFAELREHALFASALAARSETRARTAVGRGKAWTYVVRSPEGIEPASVTAFTFLQALPGPPAHMATKVGDVVFHELTQVRRSGP